MSGSKYRISIQWTNAAKEQLKSLPPKVQRGIIAKADELADSSDPRRAHKPLVGPLEGFFRLTYSRWRAIYRVDEDKLANGDVLATLRVVFVVVGKRAEYAKDDVYRLAEKLIDMRVIDGKEIEEQEGS